MADLEDHAFKRDRGFLVRLVLSLTVGILFGAVVYNQLTSQRTSNCAVNLLLSGETAAPGGRPPAPDAGKDTPAP